VWIFVARLWSVVVDTTGVVIQLKKRAWCRLQHPISLFIHAQILCAESRNLHPQRLRNSGDVASLENGAGRFATVSTVKAIDAFKCSVMGDTKLLV
jgi:hypothetical protein